MSGISGEERLMDKSKKIGALIQARMGSTRLPGKVMAKVKGKPLLYYLIERLRVVERLDTIVVTTTTQEKDDAIVDECKSLNVPFFRGSEKNVLNRFFLAAKKYGVDIIVRITADCPLIMPDLIDRACKEFFRLKMPDYLGYSLPYPEGLADISIFPFSSLQVGMNEAELPSDKEHVIVYVKNRPERFRVVKLGIRSFINKYRYTVDEDLDFKVVKKIIEDLYEPGKIITLKEIEEYSRNHPEVVNINKHITRNEGYAISLDEDKTYLKNIGKSK